MRVAVSIVVFALEGDRRFVVITVLVLAILLLSNFLPGTMGANASHSSIQHLYFSLLTVLLIFAGSIVAGMLGSLVGLGGGVLIVPLSQARSEEHTSELQSRENLVCRLLLEKKKKITNKYEEIIRIRVRQYSVSL